MKYIDNTMISTYRRCPREFYLRHVKHWRPEGTALPLVFGLAWHDALDIVWGLASSGLSDIELREAAWERFCETWEAEGLPPSDQLTMEQQELLSPRTPGNAREMLAAYIEERRNQLRRFRILDIEKPFAVPIFNTEGPGSVLYVGRRDKLFSPPSGGVYVGEHKTTTMYSKRGGFRQSYLDSFSPNSQVDGYLFATNMELAAEGKRVSGVWVDVALVHKSERVFKWLPIDRSLAMLDSWLVETRIWVERILVEIASNKVNGDAVPLTGFPKNTDSCFRYNKECPYKDLCRMRPDVNKLDEPPPGFVYDPWSPFDVLELEKLEETKNA